MHNKCIWNLNRIPLRNYAHFTIGYSQRDWNQVEELLRIAEVTVLVDARRHPVSQFKPEFSKSNLKTYLDAAGLTYWHIPELGIDASDREELSDTLDYDSLFSDYDRTISIDYLQQILGEKLDSERLAFLCVELDPHICHRHRIALLLEEMGYSTLDL
jgi:uncharacterized protein (DUF488 family)